MYANDQIRIEWKFAVLTSWFKLIDLDFCLAIQVLEQMILSFFSHVSLLDETCRWSWASFAPCVFVHVTILFGSAILQMMVDCIEDEPAVTVLLGRTRVPDSGRLVHEEKIPLELIWDQSVSELCITDRENSHPSPAGHGAESSHWADFNLDGGKINRFSYLIGCLEYCLQFAWREYITEIIFIIYFYALIYSIIL